MAEFRQDLWEKAINENLERDIENIKQARKYFQEHYKKVKHYKIKCFMNRIFRTKFELYERKEEKPLGKIRIRKFGE